MGIYNQIRRHTMGIVIRLYHDKSRKTYFGYTESLDTGHLKRSLCQKARKGNLAPVCRWINKHNGNIKKEVVKYDATIEDKVRFIKEYEEKGYVILNVDY